MVDKIFDRPYKKVNRFSSLKGFIECCGLTPIAFVAVSISLKGGGSMSRIISMCVRICPSSAICLMIYGCILNPIAGSGYAVDIAVAPTQFIDAKDVSMVEHIATREKFVKKQTRPRDKRECLLFGRDLGELRFQHLDYKFIILGCCYTREYISSSTEALTKLRVIINNDWGGQQQPIKQEIDRLGDIFYAELAARFGKKNVKIERRRTGPPF